MLIRTGIFLLYCLLIAVAAGCAAKTEVVQQSSSTQPTSSPQQPAPVAATNTQAEQQQQQNLNAATGSTNAATDACALITGAEIQEVQGEAVKDTKSSNRSSGAFAISQCFYSLPTYNKSVSLEVTRNNPAKSGESNELKEFWNKTFSEKADAKEEKEEKEERDKDRKAEKKEEKERGGREEGEEEEGSKPVPVPGVGDEAYWSGNARAGALYVLKNNAFIRISIGGPSDEATKIEKTKALARKAIARL